MGSKKLIFRQTTEQIQKNITKSDVIKNQMTDMSFIDLSKSSETFIDVKLMTPEETIKQSIENLLKLPVGGNPLFPERGEDISKMLFNQVLNREESIQYVKSYIETNEPRITINSVVANKIVNDYNEQIISIDLSYSFKNSKKIYDLTIDVNV